MSLSAFEVDLIRAYVTHGDTNHIVEMVNAKLEAVAETARMVRTGTGSTFVGAVSDGKTDDKATQQPVK